MPKVVFDGLRYLSISSIKELVSLERSWRALSSLEIGHLDCLIFAHLNIVGTEYIEMSVFVYRLL